MIDETATPMSVSLPVCVTRSDVFDGQDAGVGRMDWPVIVDRSVVIAAGVELGRWGLDLSSEHKHVWTALYVYALLREKMGAERPWEFAVCDEGLAHLLDIDAADSQALDRVWEIATDLCASGMDLFVGRRPGKAPRFWAGQKFLCSARRNTLSGVWEFRLSDMREINRHLGFDEVLVPEQTVGVVLLPPPEPIGPICTIDRAEFEEVETASPPTRQPKPSGPGFVYILTNPSMPGLIKIGKTRLACVEDRAAQLHSTGVPDAFEVAYACRTDDPDAVERVMHEAFGPKRLTDRREFFQLDPQQAIAVLSLHG